LLQVKSTMEDRRRNTVHNGFSMLIKAIEELSGGKVNAQSAPDENLDIQDIRKKEAQEAFKEISKQQKAKRERYISNLYEQHVFNRDFNFKNIIVDSANQQAVSVCDGFATSTGSYDGKLSSPPLLLIWGSVGSGKTVMCNCVANKILNEFESTVDIASTFDLKKTRFMERDTYVNEENQQRWEHFVHVGVMILDGITANVERLTKFERQVISELIRCRRELNLPMVITTSMAPQNLKMDLADDIYESMREYSVLVAPLFGDSRRPSF